MSEPDPFADDPRVQAGLDHLQRAAREVIAASRALLDVAEELVDDPRAAASLADVLGSLGGLAARGRSWTGTGGGAGGSDRLHPDVDGDEDDGDGGPGVQRIPVS